MDKNNLRPLLIAGGALALLLAIAAGGTIWLHNRTTTGTGFLAELTRGVQSVTRGASAVTPANAEFAFRRLEIDTSKPQAEACLVFTHPLDATGKTHYEDYVTLDPATKVAARVVDARLCLAGLAFDKTYT